MRLIKKNDVFAEIKKNIIRLVEQDKIVEAESMLNHYIKLCPHDIESYSIYANIFVAREKYEEAEEAILSGLYYDSNNVEFLFNLATILELRSEKRQAQNLYELALKKTDNNDIAQFSSEALLRLKAQDNCLKNVKIFHGTIEIANQMSILSESLQRNGLLVEKANYYPSYLKYNEDTPKFVLESTSVEEFKSKEKRFSMGRIYHNDIFHFHFGTTLRQDHSDLVLLKELNKQVYMHHWGSEVRQLSIARRHNPYVKVKESNEELLRSNIREIAKKIDTCIVCDEELKLYVKDYYSNVVILPLAVDTRKYIPDIAYEYNCNTPLTIVHAPTHGEVKGTDVVLRVVEKLSSEFPIVFKLVQGMAHEEAKKIYQTADLIIDQIRVGCYGVFAIESMSMGKPVISWISDFMKDNYPEDLPIINANPDSLETILRKILMERDSLSEIGRKSRNYVVKYHDIRVVGKNLLDIYGI